MPRPPQNVRRVAARALERRRRLRLENRNPGGTAVGVARARDLAAGRKVSHRTLVRMRAFFDRWAGRYAEVADDPDSPIALAWALWGGTAGRRWVERVLRGKGIY